MKKPAGWRKKEWNKTESGFQKELKLNLKPKAEKAILDVFKQTSDSFVSSGNIPSRETPTMPFITGNLHDSIVSVVSNKGHVVKASYTDKVATRPQSGLGRKRIIGSQYAFTAVKNMQGKYPETIASSLWVAVPYAEEPNEKGRHIGYLNNLRLLYAHSMESNFRFGISKGILELKGTLDQYVQIAYDPQDLRMVKPYGKRGRKKGSKTKTMGSASPGMSLRLKP